MDLVLSPLKEIAKLFQNYDVDVDGKINRFDFQELIKQLLQNYPYWNFTERQINNVFDCIDEFQTGKNIYYRSG